MKKAFTLIELMVVISVIAILATIALFGFGQAQASARDVGRAQIMNGIRTALERYYGDNQKYPVMTTGICGALGVLVPTYLAAYPTDPQAKVNICGNTGGCLGTSNPICGGKASYTYATTTVGGVADQTYTLTLVKESGGTQTFASPQ